MSPPRERRQPQRSCVGCRTVRAKRELIRVVRTPTGEIRLDDTQAQKVPGRAMVDGLLIFSAGVLLVIPGFVTALIGLLLLIPPTRVPVREYLIRRWTRRARAFVRTAPGPNVIRTDSVIVTDRADRAGRSDPQELGGQRAIEAGDEPLG